MLVLVLNIILNLTLVGNQSNAGFEKKVEIFLHKTYTEYNDMEFTIEDNLDEFSEITINYDREPNRIGNKFYLPVSVIMQNGESKERFLNVNLKIFENVLVTTQSIAEGELITPANAEFQRTDITGFNFEPLTEKDVTENFICKYDLRPKTVINTRQIKRQPIIEPGSQIEAIFTRGTVIISFDGVAKQSGAEGDIIRIKANDTQYSARIVNSKQVNIIE